MFRTSLHIAASLLALAGCSQKSPYAKPDPHAQAAESAAIVRATGSAAVDPDAGITDPDQLIERGWSRHLQHEDGRPAFASALARLRTTTPAPPGPATGPGLIEGLATSTDGTAAAVKTPSGLLFFRPDSGTVTGWRRLEGSLAQPGAIAFHPVRLMLSVVVSNPAPGQPPGGRSTGPAIHIIDSRSMADLPVPTIDAAFVPSVSPSGTRIAYLRDNALHLLDVDAGKDRYAALPQPSDTVPSLVRFAPDTKTFAVVDVVNTPRGPRNSQLRLVNAVDGRVIFSQPIESTRDSTSPTEDPPAMDFTADGASFRFVDAKGKLMSVDRTTGAARVDSGQPPVVSPVKPLTVPVLDKTVCHAYGRVMPAGACS